MIAKRALYRPDIEAGEVGRMIRAATPGVDCEGNALWVYKRLRLEVGSSVQRAGLEDAIHDGMARGIRYALAIMYADHPPNEKIEMAHNLLLYAERLGGPDADFQSAAEFLTEALPG